MLRKNKIIVTLILVTSFLMNSCYKDEELESINSQTAIKKRNISFEELNNKLNRYKKYKVHQERADGDGFITSLDTDNIIELETEEKTTYTLKANTTADDTTNFTNIIFVEKNGQLEKYLLKYEPTEAWKIARLTDANISYSGNNIILDFDGNVLAESQVVDGITVSKTSVSMTCYEFEWYSDVIHLESYYILVEVPCDEPIDTEIDEGDSGDGGGTDTSGDGDGSTTSGTGTDGDSSNDNGTGDNADTGNDGDPIFTEPVFGDNDGDEDLMAQLNALLCDSVDVTQFNTVDIETIQIILDYLQESNSGGCSEIDFDSLTRIIPDIDKICQGQIIFNSILNNDFLNSEFGTLIKNAFLEPNGKNVAFKNVPTGDGDLEVPEGQAAQTGYMRSFTQAQGEIVIIKLRNEFLDSSTDLGIVINVFHELLHAYIVNLYHDNLLISTYPNYIDLNQAYINYMSDTSDTIYKEILNQEMHNIYIDFIDDFTNLILDYSDNNNIEIDFNQAENLIWGSLIGNDVFTNNLNTEEQNQAEQKINNEILNQNAVSPKTCD